MQPELWPENLTHPNSPASAAKAEAQPKPLPPEGMGASVGGRRKQIPLGNGRFAVVDEQDWESLNKHKWSAQKSNIKSREVWYAKRVDDGRKIYMHREIAAVSGFPQVDHRDGNGLHNWRENLRPATQNQNQWNKTKTPNRSSQFKGVYWDKDRSLWKAQICFNGKRRGLGRFSDEREAAMAYNAAALLLFGYFSKLNPV